jgi:hypothetical protein
MRASHIYRPKGDPDKVVYVFVISVMGDKSTVRVTSRSKCGTYMPAQVMYVPTSQLELIP